MHKLVLVLALVTLALPAIAQTIQQERMKVCNTEVARNKLKGEERRVFMKSCASANMERTAPLATMEKCNADAVIRNLQGEERRKFMKECWSAG